MIFSGNGMVRVIKVQHEVAFSQQSMPIYNNINMLKCNYSY